MFSPYAVSVRADWDQARSAPTPNEVNGYTETYARDLWAGIAAPTELSQRCTRADLMLMNALRVRLVGGDVRAALRLAEAGRDMAALIDHPDVRVAPVYPTLSTELQALMDAPHVLRARVSLAVALTLDPPLRPDTTQLAAGVRVMLDAYRAIPRPLPRDAGTSGVLLGIVSALLAERIDDAAELIALRSSQSSFKRQFAMLKLLVRTCEKRLAAPAPAGPIEDPKLQRMFFEIFNAYRLPLHSARAAALGEAPLGTNYSLIDAYLYAWLYRLHFSIAPGGTTSWEDMVEFLTA